MTTDVFCYDCNHVSAVGRVTASIRCQSCQSPALGLLGVDPKPSRVLAARQGGGFTQEAVTKAAGAAGDPSVGKSGWVGPDPRRTEGYNEYVGPTPQNFPRSAPVSMSTTCPECHGSKYDLIDKGPCRECGGSGIITHPTSRPDQLNLDGHTQVQPAGGAGWHGASRRTAVTPEEHARAWHDEDEQAPCRDPWCVANEPEHTENEHIDPPHLDPGHEDYHSAERSINEAFGHDSPAWLLDHQHGGPSKYSRYHSGFTAEAVQRVADMSRRLYAEHPSGYRAEWTGGNRFHVYEGDTPVDSPPIPGYGDHLNSGEAEAVRDKFKQKHLEKGLNSWAKENGAEYMDFNHGSSVHGPSDSSYGERHGYTGSRTAGRPSTDPMGSVEDHIRHSTPDYPGNDPARFTHRSPNVGGWAPAAAPAGPYQMDQAQCPECGHAPTQLKKDKNEDAWWHCPNCGPLANIDKRPDVNPYSPPGDFEADRNMKTASRLSRNRRTGRVFKIVEGVLQANAVSLSEALDLARNTVRRFPEGR